jgi:hypothetical protein
MNGEWRDSGGWEVCDSLLAAIPLAQGVRRTISGVKLITFGYYGDLMLFGLKKMGNISGENLRFLS